MVTIVATLMTSSFSEFAQHKNINMSKTKKRYSKKENKKPFKASKPSKYAVIIFHVIYTYSGDYISVNT